MPYGPEVPTLTAGTLPRKPKSFSHPDRDIETMPRCDVEARRAAVANALGSR